YVIIVSLLIIYIKKQGHWQLKKSNLINPKKRKEMLTYAGFNLFAGMSSFMALRIDSVMIPNIMSEDIFTNNGVYGIAAFMGNAIAIPYTSIINISSPLISESIKKEDLKHVKELYQKASTNLLLIGFCLFALVNLSINDLFIFMDASDTLKNSVAVVTLIGLAKLFDMGSSLNNQIINFSKYYKYYIIFISIMAVTNIALNIVFIQKYGIVGAAIATCISMFIFNLLKLLFIQFKFKINPFSKSTFQLLFIFIISVALIYFIPLNSLDSLNLDIRLSSILKIVLRSSLFLFVYFGLILFIKPSKDFHTLLLDLWSGLKKGKLNLK
ncbi:MAG: polysaccharide biosynthesis C-terminal domain-containing protein, partial [Bacteroidota bacterium]